MGLVGNADVDGAIESDAVPGQAGVVRCKRCRAKTGQGNTSEDCRGKNRLARRPAFIECLPTWLFIEVPLGADRGQFCTPPPCGGRTCSVAKPESMVCDSFITSSGRALFATLTTSLQFDEGHGGP
jgi:hypothetical protein